MDRRSAKIACQDISVQSREKLNALPAHRDSFRINRNNRLVKTAHRENFNQIKILLNVRNVRKDFINFILRKVTVMDARLDNIRMILDNRNVFYAILVNFKILQILHSVTIVLKENSLILSVSRIVSLAIAVLIPILLLPLSVSLAQVENIRIRLENRSAFSAQRELLSRLQDRSAALIAILENRILQLVKLRVKLAKRENIRMLLEVKTASVVQRENFSLLTALLFVCFAESVKRVRWSVLAPVLSAMPVIILP